MEQNKGDLKHPNEKRANVYVASDYAYLDAAKRLLNNGEITLEQYAQVLRRFIENGR